MLCCRANLIFAVALTLRGHEADTFLAYWLIYVIFVSYRIYSLSILFGFGSRINAFIWWICTGKNSLHSPECKSVRWINYFIYAIFPCSVISCYLVLFRPIAASQVAAIKNLFHFYSSPVALGQICLVLVTHDPISRNGYVPHWSLTIKLSSFSDLFMEVVYWMVNEWRFILSNRRRKAT